MKKYLFLFLLIAVFALPGSVIAKTIDDQQPTSSKSSVFSNYELPYPGMLPDSPLYKIKVLRDKLILFLITEPQKKVEFHLLQADKGISSASMLLNKGNPSLAIQTALKAEHNMTLIPEQIRLMQVKPSGSMFDKLIDASKKHQEILGGMIKKAEGNEQKSLKQVLYFSQENLKTLEKYEMKNPKRWNEWN